MSEARLRQKPSQSAPPTGTLPTVGGLSGAQRRRAHVQALAFRQVSSLYILVLLIGVYSLWVPETFLSLDTWRSLLDTQALTAMAAVALLIPIAAGVFDISLGAEVGLASVFVSWLLVEHRVPVSAAVPLTLLSGAVIGALSAFAVTILNIDSLIATLAVSSIGVACTDWLSGGQQILNLPQSFVVLGSGRLLGISYPVYIMVGVAGLTWYGLECTPSGRRVYATGGNPQAARLAGVSTSAVMALSLIACGVIAAGAGLLLAARLGAGDPTVGPSFLLPAFSAVFLGATQFRVGRFNVWGTVVAVYVLAVGVKGLQLAGAPVWIPDLFNGLALLVAVGVAKYERNRRWLGAVRRMLRGLPGASPR